MTTILIIIATAIVIILLWLITTYNKFIAKNNRVKQTESSISVMLKQRNNMIPNLVAAVQNYMGHENATLTKIAELRAQMQQSGNEHEKIQPRHHALFQRQSLFLCRCDARRFSYIR